MVESDPFFRTASKSSSSKLRENLRIPRHLRLKEAERKKLTSPVEIPNIQFHPAPRAPCRCPPLPPQIASGFRRCLGDLGTSSGLPRLQPARMPGGMLQGSACMGNHAVHVISSFKLRSFFFQWARTASHLFGFKNYKTPTPQLGTLGF